MSQVLRYVWIEGPEITVVESFLDFFEVGGKKAEDLTKLICEKLAADGPRIEDCRGQAYDNAAVMAGEHSGIQTRIKSMNPQAQFVARSNHRLNMAGVHAATEGIGTVNFFGNGEEVLGSSRRPVVVGFD